MTWGREGGSGAGVLENCLRINSSAWLRPAERVTERWSIDTRARVREKVRGMERANKQWERRSLISLAFFLYTRTVFSDPDVLKMNKSMYMSCASLCTTWRCIVGSICKIRFILEWGVFRYGDTILLSRQKQYFFCQIFRIVFAQFIISGWMRRRGRDIKGRFGSCFSTSDSLYVMIFLKISSFGYF